MLIDFSMQYLSLLQNLIYYFLSLASDQIQTLQTHVAAVSSPSPPLAPAVSSTAAKMVARSSAKTMVHTVVSSPPSTLAQMVDRSSAKVAVPTTVSSQPFVADTPIVASTPIASVVDSNSAIISTTEMPTQSISTTPAAVSTCSAPSTSTVTRKRPPPKRKPSVAKVPKVVVSNPPTVVAPHTTQVDTCGVPLRRYFEEFRCQLTILSHRLKFLEGQLAPIEAPYNL